MSTARSSSGCCPRACSTRSQSSDGQRSISRPTERSRRGWRSAPEASLRRCGAAPGEGSLAPEPAAFALAHAAPDAELLAVLERELEALLTHHAPPADLLGLSRRRTPLGEEQVGIDAEAV